MGSAASHDNNYNLNGDLDEFMIFSEALSGDEIKGLMDIWSVFPVSPTENLATIWSEIEIQKRKYCQTVHLSDGYGYVLGAPFIYA